MTIQTRQTLDDATRGCTWRLTQVIPTTYDQDGYTDQLGYYTFTSTPAADGRHYTVVIPRLRFWFGPGGAYAYRPGDDNHERMLARLHLWADTLHAWGHNPRPAPVDEDVEDDACPYCGHPCGDWL